MLKSFDIYQTTQLEQNIILEKNNNIEEDQTIQLEQKVILENNNYKEMFNNLEKSLINENKIIYNIPTINVIYQYIYTNNIPVTGFGDFIRGCFYILQFSDSYTINIDFNIYKHPIKKYLKYFLNKEDISETISNNVAFFQKSNHTKFIKNKIINYKYLNVDNELLHFIKQIKAYDKHKYLYLINHPKESCILEQHKTKIRELFEPVYELQLNVESRLLGLNLIKRKYTIIHVRMNDNSFHNNCINFTNKQTIDVINYINSLKKKTTEDILLLCSDNSFKKHIIQQTPCIKTFFNETFHIAEKTKNTEDALINTLIEFYIMSYSNHIYCFSVYDHGSGFSKWCAVMYNIPYICIKL